jgi:ABC-type phosphate/phosphonate transport system permease subunit
MQLVWGMLNTLLLISFTLKFSLVIPDNVYLFFDIIDDILNMRAKFLQDWLDKTLDSVFVIDRASDGQDSNIMKNLGTMFVAFIGITIMIIVALVLGFLIQYA